MSNGTTAAFTGLETESAVSLLESILIPNRTLVVLSGPAGSGKSTFASRHFRKTQVVSSDDCRALISDDASNQRVSGHAFHLMHFIIAKRLLLGHLTVSDATNLSPDDRREMTNMARRFGFGAIALVFDTPLDVCLARNARRSRVVPPEALRRQYEMLEGTLKTIGEEDFDSVLVLTDKEQESSRILVDSGAPRSVTDGS